MFFPIPRITECDFTDKKFNPPVPGYACVSRGATGRWCVVMHASEKFVLDNGYLVRTEDDVRELIESGNTAIGAQAGDYCDF